MNEPASIIDEHAGMGGSYLLDPATGLRTLVERTDSTPAPASPHDAAAPATTRKPTQPPKAEA